MYHMVTNIGQQEKQKKNKKNRKKMSKFILSIII